MRTRKCLPRNFLFANHEANRSTNVLRRDAHEEHIVVVLTDECLKAVSIHDDAERSVEQCPTAATSAKCRDGRIRGLSPWGGRTQSALPDVQCRTARGAGVSRATRFRNAFAAIVTLEDSLRRSPSVCWLNRVPGFSSLAFQSTSSSSRRRLLRNSELARMSR